VGVAGMGYRVASIGERRHAGYVHDVLLGAPTPG
jgi:hypothetical protein